MPTFRTSQPVSAADPSKPHVILVGLPGSGKSTVGEAVAKQLSRSFLDLDVEIERREGRSVGDIFAEKGEPHFRKLERSLTEELTLVGHMIVAPGGGWIGQPDVVAMIRPPGRLIYLKVRPETALQRLGANRASRPLLTHPNPLGEMRRLLAVRRDAYSSAEFVVNAELISLKRVIEEVAAIASTI